MARGQPKKQARRAAPPKRVEAREAKARARDQRRSKQETASSTARAAAEPSAPPARTGSKAPAAGAASPPKRVTRPVDAGGPRRRWPFVLAAVVVVGAIVAVVAWYLPNRDDDAAHVDPARPGVDVADPALIAADTFAKAWVDGRLADAPVAVGEADTAERVQVVTAGLTPAEKDRPASVVVHRIERTAAGGEDQAVAHVTVTWNLDGGHVWTYPTTWALRREVPKTASAGADPTWGVAMDSVAPGLAPGELLVGLRIPATRGRIVDALGQPYLPDGGSVVVGIRKSRSADVAGLVRTVAGLTGVDPAALEQKVANAGPEDFVDVATLTRTDYDRIRAQIQPLPGTVFREEAVESDLPASFATGLLGTTGSATAEIVEASKGRVREGDITGLRGMQKDLDDTLGGTPGLHVQAVPTAPAGPARTLTSFDPIAGKDVALTIDRRIQLAADAAVAGSGKSSALVAIRVSTGDVVAVANGPTAAAGFNRAMLGRYPPGSTFKVATALGLLERGVTPDTIINCPATIVVGKKFKNAGGEVLGKVPFRTIFAESCNTGFVGQAKTLSSKDLAEVAQRLGYRELDLGVPVFGGSVPVTDDLSAEHGADMIGQGKVEASPLAVALVSASVAAGRSLVPRLIVNPNAPAAAPGEALPAQPVADLRSLMRSVVVSGTGTAVKRVPGGEVSGKTGTAEFGTESPPRTHAWFTGFQGDIAFAVLVQDGGFGGAVAAPIAARFLTTLAG